MTPRQHFLSLMISALLWLPGAANAQHSDHSHPADHSHHPQHSRHSQPMDPTHHEADHAQHHSAASPHNPPSLPVITDADRAAAFPRLQHHHSHGASTHAFWLVDQLEASDSNNGTETHWEGSGWVGSDLNRLWLRSEGRAQNSTVERGQIEALYGKPVLPWWDVVAGVRHDFGDGPNRTWAAFGLQGTAPYFFELEATAYIGESGRTALSFTAEYDMLLTNRLILSWEAEANAFGKTDEELLIGSGLSTVEFGLRLRYEITRQFAPYVGYVQEWSYGATADLRELHQRPVDEHRWVAGVRLWF